jgi:hypothetical protein
VAIPFSVRAGALAAVAALVALLILLLAGPAHAERPGWYSNPSIVSGSPSVGSTLSGSDGGLHCAPACAPDGPNPEYAGSFLEWLSCTGPSGGGADRPTGGMPDDPRQAPGCVSRGAPAKGATSYTVRPDDAGRYIQLHVVATNYDCGEWRRDTGETNCRYSSGNGYSATIGPIGGSAAAPPPPPPPPPASSGPPNMTAYPTTSGSAMEGQKLTATTGAWTSSPTKYAYQWKRCAPEFEPCSPIAGATSQSYVVTMDDVGKRLQVLVTATNAKGSNSAASFPTDVVGSTAVAPANTALPTIAGTVEDRQTLTASPGTWTGTETIAFTYQWLRCSTKLAGCAPIAGATNATYVVGREDLAARLSVTVTATNRAGTTTATSALTDHVASAKPRPGADRLTISDLAPQNGLVVAGAQVGRGTVGPRGTISVTVKVTDRRGFLIGGASVTVTGPRGAIARGVTVTTDASGTAAVKLRAGKKLPKGKLVLTITVTKPGDASLSATKRVAVSVRSK